MFAQGNDVGYSTPIEGIQQKTLVYGAKTLMTEFRLKAGRVLPLHQHPYEQTGYLVRGRLRLIVGQEKHDAHPGDSWCIAPDVTHGAEVIEDSVAIEVFSPPREDYLPHVRPCGG
jgi:quercetin dioxygenase-like cupin family protein